MGKNSSISSIIITAGLAGAAIFCLTERQTWGMVPSQNLLGDAARPQQNRTASKEMILNFMVFYFCRESSIVSRQKPV